LRYTIKKKVGMISEPHPNWYHNTQPQTALTAVAYGLYLKYVSMFCATNEVQTATHVPLDMH